MPRFAAAARPALKMRDDQQDIVVSGEVVARLIRRDQVYVLFSLDPRLRAIDENVYDSPAAAREAVLVTIDSFARDAD